MLSMLYRGTWLTAASGKLNGNVASHNRGGAYLRTHFIPTDPDTTRQGYLRTAAASAAAQWQANTPEERQGWQQWAAQHPRPNRLGDKHTHSGWNEFCRWAIPRYAANSLFGSAIGVGNAVPHGDEAKLATIPTAVVNAGSSTVNVTYDASEAWTSDQDAVLLFYVASVRSAPGVRDMRCLRPTINWYRGPYQLAYAQQGDPDGPLSGTFYINLAADADTNERLFYRFVLSTDDRGQSTSYPGVHVAT